MSKFKKKPVIVEAEVYKLGVEDGLYCACYEQDITNKKGYIPNCTECSYRFKNSPCSAKKPYINTLEGRHFISEGDYIITGVKGERYPCKPDIFEMTYELVEE